jgi:hypothetical protein
MFMYIDYEKQFTVTVFSKFQKRKHCDLLMKMAKKYCHAHKLEFYIKKIIAAHFITPCTLVLQLKNNLIFYKIYYFCMKRKTLVSINNVAVNEGRKCLLIYRRLQ